MHLISKFRTDSTNNGNPSRIGIILNGSPLFTGGAGSGESEIRRYILEADLLEAIVALPTDMFYNTGIATYIWVLTNKKSDERKGKVQLINGANLFGKMRKSLGSKRNIMSEADRKSITRSFGAFEATSDEKFASKIFETHEFGYRRITAERPLRLSAQITDEAVASLQYAPKPLNAVMRWMEEEFSGDIGMGVGKNAFLPESKEIIRKKIKTDFKELKEKQIKAVMDELTWLVQSELMAKAEQIQEILGKEQFDDFNDFDQKLKAATQDTTFKLDAKEKKQFLDAITWKNPEAEPVVKKVLKEEAQPLYGAFEYKGKVVEFQPDGDLRDNENIPLDPSVSNAELIETYFNREVAPHVPDAWINADKCDAQDEQIGVVGYEIPFNRHFYVYQPPRALEAIDADLDAVSGRIMKLLAEVHS